MLSCSFLYLINILNFLFIPFYIDMVLLYFFVSLLPLIRCRALLFSPFFTYIRHELIFFSLLLHKILMKIDNRFILFYVYLFGYFYITIIFILTIILFTYVFYYFTIILQDINRWYVYLILFYYFLNIFYIILFSLTISLSIFFILLFFNYISKYFDYYTN